MAFVAVPVPSPKSLRWFSNPQLGSLQCPLRATPRLARTYDACPGSVRRVFICTSQSGQPETEQSPSALAGEERDSIQLIDDMPRRIFDVGPTNATQEIRARREARAETGTASSELIRGAQALLRDFPRQPTSATSPQISAEELEKSRREYIQLKKQLLLSTIALGAAGALGTFFVYSDQTAFSYSVGVIGSVAYLILLSRRVETGLSTGAGVVVPVVLTLLSRKYEYLQLFPSIIGFFSYKLAVLYYTFRTVLTPDEEDK